MPCTLDSWPHKYNYLYHSLVKKGPWAEHLTSLPKRGVGTLSTVSAFNHERVPTSCLQWLEALEANNWMQNNVQRNHQGLRSWVLMAHNTWNCTMWWWAYCSSHLVSRLPWGCSPHYLRPWMQRCCVKYHTQFLTRDTHSARGCASQTLCEAHSRMGAHSGELCPYTRKLAKSRGWALFSEWALFGKTTVIWACITTR